MKKKCLICHSENIKKIIEIRNAPQNIQFLLTKNTLQDDKKISLHISKCNSCNLIQLTNHNVIPKNYYDDYVMSTSFSKDFEKYLESLTKELVQKFNLKNKNILEIGCGDGLFLHKFTKHGVKVLGIEPSKRFSKLKKDASIKILNIYFTIRSKLPLKEYDAIVSRQVFEHLKNPNEVLQTYYKFLKNDGIGLIEVPSFEKAIKNNRFYDIFSDHIAYYTKETLSHLVLRNNFEILDIFDSFNDEYLVIIFRKKPQLSLEKFANEFDNLKTDLVLEIKKLKKKYKKIVMWGAGGKGNSLLSIGNLNASVISFIVDSDPNKIGKYTRGSHIPVKSPSELDDKVDAIIISAIAFKNEILKELTKKKFTGDIYLISPRLHKITN